MSYLLKGCPSAIYMFKFVVKAQTEEAAIKKAMPTIKRCEEFAEALHIYCGANHIGLIDGELSIRLIFNIKEPQNSILMKVPALFSFAASLQLELTNQTFHSEETL